ncbi:hypothetical protein JZ751_010337 [Albula glossodonta]|uniref:C2 domain-containing protein n=1 Tax=Albula glossodonta TaxID=121402 RepID=A0A8T2P4W7_9TELE|nr:hypothetical protein JZ751_010337 [Albula glossodonta]
MIKAKFTSSPPQLPTAADHQREETHMGQLSILVTGANNLAILRSSGSLNSFVKGCLALPSGVELTQKTQVQRRRSGPDWGHRLLFTAVPEASLKGSSLELGLWDHAPFGLPPRPLGRAKLEGACSWQKLLQTPNMWLEFSLPFHPSANGKKTVLYLSRPARTFSVCSRSFCVFLLSSRAWASSELSAWETQITAEQEAESHHQLLLHTLILLGLCEAIFLIAVVVDALVLQVSAVGAVVLLAVVLLIIVDMLVDRGWGRKGRGSHHHVQLLLGLHQVLLGLLGLRVGQQGDLSCVLSQLCSLQRGKRECQKGRGVEKENQGITVAEKLG